MGLGLEIEEGDPKTGSPVLPVNHISTITLLKVQARYFRNVDFDKSYLFSGLHCTYSMFPTGQEGQAAAKIGLAYGNSLGGAWPGRLHSLLLASHHAVSAAKIHS